MRLLKGARGALIVPAVAVLATFLSGQSALAATDVSAPVIVSSYIDKSAVDVTGFDASFALSVRISDETGVADFFGRVIHRETGQYYYLSSEELRSGTVQNGVWRSVGTIPQGAAAGTWVVEIFGLQDTLANRTGGFLAVRSISVTSAATDVSAPVIVSSYIDKSAVDVTGFDASFALSVRISDETGVADFFGRVIHRETGQYYYLSSEELRSGTVQNGVWRSVGTIPQGAAAGTWVVEIFGLQDT
ncbi:hypothetical protein V1639_07170, partial [Pseudarthrobacter sp. J75]|nr:hypothetical protein [Pseudarthrobacter sp. J75]